MPAIAEQLQISTRGFAMFCDRHAIPRPWRGYWRQREMGLAADRVPLRDHAVNTTLEFEIAESRAQHLEEVWRVLESGEAPASSEPDRTPLRPEGQAPDGRIAQLDTTPSRLAHPPPASAPDATVAAARTQPSPPAELRPELAALAALARRYQQLENEEHFLDALLVRAKTCEPVTAALVANWVEIARTQIRLSDPIGDFIAACAALAHDAAASLLRNISLPPE
jgi:hypothetical protein